ncbi:c-type cytochrome [Atlantibacter subterranea]|uniref:C-type cytochrome n=1 Tax=Atlantibacter subterraneus TaxID=255519 RepID=A0ABU4DXQ8_9ENTR|nr:c-type cytochrome [Atlantibacter subterranea]MDV7021266.1 c-type cytochrome [Atlantibacter subterranea]MDZ5664636.1 c-type cytochrome [Atlantibacter hermannii]
MTLRMLMVCGLLAVSASVAATEDYARQFQRDCSSCHGRKADKTAFNKAPPLITLSEQQAVEGMTAIRDGGENSAAARAKAKLTDEEIRGLAAFIQTQK